MLLISPDRIPVYNIIKVISAIFFNLFVQLFSLEYFLIFLMVLISITLTGLVTDFFWLISNNSEISLSTILFFIAILYILFNKVFKYFDVPLTGTEIACCNS